MQRVAPNPAASPSPPPPPRHPKKTCDSEQFKHLLQPGRAAGRALHLESAGQKSIPDDALPEVLADARRRRGTGDEPGSGREELPAEPECRPAPASLDPLCDPLGRALAQVAPRANAAPDHAALPPALLPEIEQLLGRLVRRAAFGGDGRRGTARLEIGAGALAGATLLVQADAGELTIDVDLPPGAAAEEWRARLADRLAARGLAVREITVR